MDTERVETYEVPELKRLPSRVALLIQGLQLIWFTIIVVVKIVLFPSRELERSERVSSISFHLKKTKE